MPAGTYFRGYDTCGGCNTPTHVLLAALVDTPAAAESVVAALPETSRRPGYPMVLHTDELGLADERSGIAIVVGLFDDAEAANAWAVHDGGRATVVPLLDDDKWWSVPHGSARVVRVAVPMAKAYDRRAVDRLETELQDREWRTLEEAHTGLRERVLALDPVCTLAQGSIQLWTPNDAEPTPWYQWVPVRCGDVLAYVAWRDTWLDSSVVTTEGDVYEVVQVAGAECDSPVLRRWSFTSAGKSTDEPRRPLVARGNC